MGPVKRRGKRRLIGTPSCGRHYAERKGYWEKTKWLSQVNKDGVTTYYDSVTGKPLFIAPRGRSFDEFIKESKAHGWPSFRDEEVVWENMRCLKDGEAVSVDGTHLGHNLPDRNGNRFALALSFPRLFLVLPFCHDAPSQDKFQHVLWRLAAQNDTSSLCLKWFSAAMCVVIHTHLILSLLLPLSMASLPLGSQVLHQPRIRCRQAGGIQLVGAQNKCRVV